MCTYSMVHRQWEETFPQRYPSIVTQPTVIIEYATKEDIERLRQELEALKEVLKAARLFDEVQGNKDCEDADKVKLVRELANLLGVDFNDVIVTN